MSVKTAGKPAKDPYDTPAMRQFKRFKDQHPGCILFFRMGDFYELFGDDAVEMAGALGITLTERQNGIKLAGVPYHQKDRYLRRAIAAGYRVAIADQTQDPKEAKGIVDRAVTRVVTPGTISDDALMPGRGDETVCALAAVHVVDDQLIAAIVDASTGAFEVESGNIDKLADDLERLGVREIVHAEDEKGNTPGSVRQLIERTRLPATARPAWWFRADEALDRVRTQFGVANAEGFGFAESDPALIAVGVAIGYLSETQAVGIDAAAGTLDTPELRSTLAHLTPPRRSAPEGVCVLDAVSLRALEIVRTIRRDDTSSDATDGSLLSVFTRAGVLNTAMGKRTLRSWLCAPLSRADDVHARQSAVAALVSDRRLAEEIAELLRGINDLERIAARVALGRPSPRDLVAMGIGVSRCGPLTDALVRTPALMFLVEQLKAVRTPLAALGERLRTTCVDDPPPHLRTGGLVRDGVDGELDEARGLMRDAGEWMADYQAKLNAEHDLPGLKVGFNKVFGYYIELPRAQAKRAPDAFARRQSLKNAERFVTPELKDFEARATTAEARALERERVLFAGLVDASRKDIAAVGAFARTVGTLDALLGFAEKAVRRAWVRPEVTDEPVLDICEGRHPVLDELLGEGFVPNDVLLGANGDTGETAPGAARLALITGPNMAGKSTYIRQCALLTVLASAGSFVPAASATIGTCDRVFTRVGADDALHRGQSTFMVEMTETAAILNHATPRSLVVLDEIGRGTSTLDGLSLAWAIAESLAMPDGHRASDGNTAFGPRTLFATHYHELTELEDRLQGPAGKLVANLHVQVREWADATGRPEIVFVHRIRPGRAETSYGVHVARLAGVPESVTARADEVLRTLSVQQGTRIDTKRVEAARPKADAQLGLFTEFVPHPAVEALKEVKLEGLTPLGAFDELRRLAALAQSSVAEGSAEA
ncbi:MAG: DNA mismatch repair protein MutS [Planctomycetota bacterium]